MSDEDEVIEHQVERAMWRDDLAAAIIELAEAVKEAEVYDPIERDPRYEAAFSQVAHLLDDLTTAQAIAQALERIRHQWMLEAYSS